MAVTKLPQHLNQLPLHPCRLPDAAGRLDVRSSTLHRTQRSSLDVWEYEPGDFEWRSDADHSACVLSGLARLSLADGRDVELRPGVSFYLPQGMLGRWRVVQRLRTLSTSERRPS